MRSRPQKNRATVSRNRCNSDTDSDSLDERRRVWHFAMLFFDAYTLEGNFRVLTIEKERFL